MINPAFDYFFYTILLLTIPVFASYAVIHILKRS